MILKNIYSILVQREIAGLSKLMDQQKIIMLVKLLSTQTANLINYSNLAQQCSLNQSQVKGLLSLFEKVFLIRLLSPFYSNKQSEIVKNPKVFFIDTGLRNAILDDFSTFRTDIGIQYESFIYGELTKQDLKFNYWRTKTKAEVDFVIRLGQCLIPVEVKANNPKITRSFRSFIDHYNPKTAILFNSESHDQSVINGTNVYRKYFSEIIKLEKWVDTI
jgi:predicted AAA+ superfamily ATPase